MNNLFLNYKPIILCLALGLSSCAKLVPVREEGWAFDHNSRVKAASVKCRIFDDKGALRYVITWLGKVYNTEGARVGYLEREWSGSKLTINNGKALIFDDGQRVNLNITEIKKIEKEEIQFQYTCRYRGEVFS